MKTIIAFLCLASSLIANEVPVEEVKIDPLLKVKEQFSKSRKKGWDFSEENKKSQPQKKSEGITFEFSDRNEKLPSHAKISRDDEIFQKSHF